MGAVAIRLSKLSVPHLQRADGAIVLHRHKYGHLTGKALLAGGIGGALRHRQLGLFRVEQVGHLARDAVNAARHRIGGDGSGGDGINGGLRLGVGGLHNADRRHLVDELVCEGRFTGFRTQASGFRKSGAAHVHAFDQARLIHARNHVNGPAIAVHRYLADIAYGFPVSYAREELHAGVLRQRDHLKGLCRRQHGLLGAGLCQERLVFNGPLGDLVGH